MNLTPEQEAHNERVFRSLELIPKPRISRAKIKSVTLAKAEDAVEPVLRLNLWWVTRMLWCETIAYVKSCYHILTSYRHSNTSIIRLNKVIKSNPQHLSIATDEKGDLFVKLGESSDYRPIQLDKPILSS